MAELERSNYAAMLSSARVTPGLEVRLRDDVILTMNEILPTPDTNHACLLRTNDEEGDRLIAEITSLFRGKNLPIAVYLSPACAPNDLSERLLKRGFEEQHGRESWMVLENLPGFDLPSPYAGLSVRSITRREADLFTEVFVGAFGLPGDFAPVMGQLLEPTVGLPSVYHYVVEEDGKAIGTCSLLCHEGFGVLGSTAVLETHRRSGAATNLAIRAIADARESGVDTLMLQTAADTWLERFLRISGFRRAFVRSWYVLSDDVSG